MFSVAMCVPDYKFCSYLPSVIAGASIAAALNGLEYAAIHKYDLFTKLHVITGAPKVSVVFYMRPTVPTRTVRVPRDDDTSFLSPRSRYTAQIPHNTAVG